MRRLISASLVPLLYIAIALTGSASAGEKIGKVQQPIINGREVDVATQRELGLVTVAGCSGTLINRYWVLTADHCVTADSNIGGPSFAPANIRITAAWSTKVLTPTLFVRNWQPRLDVSLIFLGAGDFGKANVQLLYVDQVDRSMTVRAYGRGMSA